MHNGLSGLFLTLRSSSPGLANWLSVVSGYILRISDGGPWQQIQPHNLFVAGQVVDQVDQAHRIRSILHRRVRREQERFADLEMRNRSNAERGTRNEEPTKRGTRNAERCSHGTFVSTTALSGPSPASLAAVILIFTVAPAGRPARVASLSSRRSALRKSASTPTTCTQTL